MCLLWLCILLKHSDIEVQVEVQIHDIAVGVYTLFLSVSVSYAGVFLGGICTVSIDKLYVLV
ncbi:hypothetical protein HYPSUDRAFT_65798 [Hypholoma sublateritium FD-334 SS-4]|uniref:Uncharacterized protein n=1 Tax=Hypholoma sublateritium (strain FD-334 SS-4) TaxID=945553 RepID=A0A0D2NZ34_HYPSF|nr:hypothetical protein HYPSUDRAFT_65798 [Hypholoma sublateritium FD-334 SS-4]